MHISCVEISNFRKLRSVRIDLEDGKTLLVGSNNSGKTSALDALGQFLHAKTFALSDVTLAHLPTIRDIGARWEAAQQSENGTSSATAKEPVDHVEWAAVLPSLDVWIEAPEAELHRAPELLPLLDDYCGGVGIRLRLEATPDLAERYLERRRGISRTLEAAEADSHPRLRPQNLVEYVDDTFSSSFSIRAYRLDSNQLVGEVTFAGKKVGLARPSGADESWANPQVLSPDAQALPRSSLDALVRVDVINAQRSLRNDSSAVALSESISDYYSDHLSGAYGASSEDLNAIQATQAASRSFDKQLTVALKEALEEVSMMGYPGHANPKPIIRTALKLTDGLSHQSVFRYQISKSDDPNDDELFELAEGLNGLGYQNLVLMIFQLISFRAKRLRIGEWGSDEPAAATVVPIHLVLVEEPEAHLHAQVQQVFVRNAYARLTNFGENFKDLNLSTQMVVSTHSSHIAHELEFSAIRYFCRGVTEKSSVPTTTVKNLKKVFGDGNDTERFVTRYLKINHCNLFFADAVILVEGAAERILLPSFVRKSHGLIDQSFVEYLEVGGSHAHRLKDLIEELEIPALVITDIDAAKDGGKVSPKLSAGQTSSSHVIKDWLGTSTSLDALLELSAESKVREGVGGSRVRFAYQTSVKCAFGELSAEELIPSTFEDALAFHNLNLLARRTGTGLLAKFSTHIKAVTCNEQLLQLPDKLFESLKGASKASFALDVLAFSDLEDFVIPTYIEEGLTWLGDQLKVPPILTTLIEPAAPTGVLA